MENENRGDLFTQKTHSHTERESAHTSLSNLCCKFEQVRKKIENIIADKL